MGILWADTGAIGCLVLLSGMCTYTSIYITVTHSAHTPTGQVLLVNIAVSSMAGMCVARTHQTLPKGTTIFTALALMQGS